MDVGAAVQPGGLTILAVEDDPRNAALLGAVFESTPHRLHVATSLAGARAWLATRGADVVLLDRHLPDGDGLALLPDIRASAMNGSARVILVTASVMDADRSAAIAAGCDAFVPKPIRIRDLLDEVEAGTRRRTQAPPT